MQAKRARHEGNAEAERLPPQSYRSLKAEILTRIRTGVWPAGTRLPTESDLAGSFGCARSTVNRALRELAAAGVVARKRRAGTTVLASAPRDARLEIPLVRAEIEAAGAPYRYELLDRRVEGPPRPVRAALDLGSREAALSLRCRHWAGDRVHQLEERWINLATVPAARTEAFETQSPNEWLIDNVPLTRALHRLSAATASAEEAASLQIAAGAALFVVTRSTWIESEPITWVRLLHPGDRYILEAVTALSG